MNWNSLDEFINMGGAGLYVWGSYAMTLLLMAIEPTMAWLRHREAKQAARDALDDQEAQTP